MKQTKIKITCSSSSLLKGEKVNFAKCEREATLGYYRGFLKNGMKKNISAFTLVEVLISMAIFSLMSVSII
ncbi:type II secretion system protein J [Patescibacteria group bacterium]